MIIYFPQTQTEKKSFLQRKKESAQIELKLLTFTSSILHRHICGPTLNFKISILKKKKKKKQREIQQKISETYM